MEDYTITSEYTPPGQGLPDWLIAGLSASTESNIMVVHPTEQHRKSTLNALGERGVAAQPQEHVTMNQLLRLLHVDFRLPVLLDDEASSFMGIHSKCMDAGENYKFPLLHSGEHGSWGMKKTQRLERLHAHLSPLLDPFNWENNPGLETYENILLAFEKERGGTLPVLLPKHVLSALNSAKSAPFHFSHIEGILILDHAPDFTEIERAILCSLSRFTPIHQLLNPGSFRLGFHGAFLVDEYPCTQETLPSWVPPHEVWSEAHPSWRSNVGRSKNTQFTRVTVDERDHILNSTIELIKHFRSSSQGRILVIDRLCPRPTAPLDAVTRLTRHSMEFEH